MGKPLVCAVSGASSIYDTHNWRSALTSLNIFSWHDCRSSTPVVYLGFPLYSSTQQRDFFLERLLRKITGACQIHKQRCLSVRGRSTVVNSLTLSKLWHVVRVVTVPMSFFKSVQSIISNFISYRIFPRISFQSSCLPLSCGGLGLINPMIQQSALQLWWLLPLLSTSREELQNKPDISDSSILSRILSFLYSQVELSSEDQFSRTPPAQLDHRLLFLFPLRRPSFLRQLTSTFSLLVKAIDMIPESFSKVVVSSSTCLEIPLSSLVLPNIIFGRSTASLLISTAYTLNTEREGCLRPKTNAEFLHRPNLSKKFLRLVSKNEIILAPFFVRSFIPARYARLDSFPFNQVADHLDITIEPFLQAIEVISTPFTSFTPLTTKIFRQRWSTSPLSPILFPLPFSPDISFPWNKFWLLPLSHSCRKIWYRFIQKKLPHKSFLHRVMPDSFTSSACPICLDPVESSSHFLFTCPSKLEVWKHMWHTYIDSSLSSFSLDILIFAIHTHRIFSSPSSISTGIPPLSAIAATL